MKLLENRNSLTQYTLISILVAIALCVAACTPADVLTSPAPSPQEGERSVMPTETIESTEVADAAPRQTGIVPGQTNLRAEATTDSGVRASLPPGTEYTVLGTTSNDPSVPADQVWLQIMVEFSNGTSTIGFVRYDVSGFNGDRASLSLLLRKGGADAPGTADIEEPIAPESPQAGSNLTEPIEIGSEESEETEEGEEIGTGMLSVSIQNLNPEYTIVIVNQDLFDQQISTLFAAWVAEWLGASSLEDSRVVAVLNGESFKAKFLTFDPNAVDDGQIPPDHTMTIEVSGEVRLSPNFVIKTGYFTDIGFGYDSHARSFFTGYFDDSDGAYVITGFRTNITEEMLFQAINGQTDSEFTQRRSSLRLQSLVAQFLEYTLGHSQTPSGATPIVAEHLRGMFENFDKSDIAVTWTLTPR